MIVGRGRAGFFFALAAADLAAGFFLAGFGARFFASGFLPTLVRGLGAFFVTFFLATRFSLAYVIAVISLLFGLIIMSVAQPKSES
ncbi:MAG TPA: hypothetical protein VFI31_10820 [Pirellulales bacterium]|nr:hypothetical protein [Pirellulales bacterium]